MSKNKNLSKIYPVAGIACALWASTALYFGLIPIWIAFALGANVFLAAGVVCGTQVKTVRRKNPLAQFSEDEPAEVEHQSFRIPTIPLLIGVLAGLTFGLIAQSAVYGLLTLLTWGGLGIPLAIAVLARQEFSDAMQSGLTASILVTAVAAFIQVFLSVPGHTFNVQYAFDLVFNKTKAIFLQALTLMQSAELPEQAGMLDLNGLTVEEAAELYAKEWVPTIPGIYAALILGGLCIVWWGLKAAVSKDPRIEIKYMGRADNYVPGRILSVVFLISMVCGSLIRQGSALQIAGANLSLICAAIIAFGGFSLILYIVNTRAKSKFLRFFLACGILALSFFVCGAPALFLIGIVNSYIDLRKLLGGGTLK